MMELLIMIIVGCIIYEVLTSEASAFEIICGLVCTAIGAVLVFIPGLQIVGRSIVKYGQGLIDNRNSSKDD